jgi:hypothetical protein
MGGRTLCKNARVAPRCRGLYGESLIVKRLLRTFPLAFLLASPIAAAADVSMAGGALHVSVPDTWVPIMQSEGETETQVFQVPGSNGADATLARVSITLQQVPNLNGFQQFSGNMRSRASGLTEYAAGKATSPTENVYTAKEGKVKLDYFERYFYSGGYAIQLRCIRPTSDARWNASFDKGCADVAAHMPS